MSIGIGRGCVSNSNGKPTTPASTSTAEPISRCLARLRMTSMLCAGAFEPAGDTGCVVARRKLKNDMVLGSLRWRLYRSAQLEK